MSDLSESLALSLIESAEQFPIDFDDAWRWIGWTTKQQGKDMLTKNFIEQLDFSRNGLKSPSGGRPSEWILLTYDCFKSLAMMAGTAKGREVRQYFLNCEKLLKQQSAPKTQLEIAQIAINQLVHQERRLTEQTRRVAALEAGRQEDSDRITAVEVEQGRYQSPCGHKYSVIGFATLRGLEVSRNEAAVKGKKATALCKQRGVEVEQVYDPRFGKVNLYPESVLDEIFI